MLIRTIALAIGTMAMIGALQVLLPTAAEAQRRAPTTCSMAQTGSNTFRYLPMTAVRVLIAPAWRAIDCQTAA